MKIFLLIVFAFAIPVNVNGQLRQIVGRVVSSENQKPIKNANVVILGTTQGTITNHLGFFSLDIEQEKNKSLVISHIGFETGKVDISSLNNFLVESNRGVFKSFIIFDNVAFFFNISIFLV